MAKQKEKQEDQHVPSADATAEQTSSLHGETVIADLIGAGSASPPVLQSQAAMFLSEDGIACNVVGDAGPASEFLLDSMRNELEQTTPEALDASVSRLRQAGGIQLVFSTEYQPIELPNDFETVIKCIHGSILQLSSGDLDDGIQLAQQHGIWTFEYNQKFALTFVSCNSPQIMKERLVADFERVQKDRERIDAERDEWLHSQAEPLLDALEEHLLDSSLPADFRPDIQAMRQQLRMDAYHYSQLVDSSSAAEITKLTSRSVQRYANSGDLGVMFRDAVVSRDEAKVFASKTRKKTGRPPKE